MTAPLDGYRVAVRRSRLANLPERIAVGAFIVNSGLTKLQADKDSAESIHGMASGTYPVLEQLPPEGFTKGLGMAECAIGGALVLPLVGDGLAGLTLSAFAAGLLGIYLQAPGLRQEDGLRPSQQGTAFAKDVWLLGIGLSLMGRSVGDRRMLRKLERARGRLGRTTVAGKARGFGATTLGKSATSTRVPDRD